MLEIYEIYHNIIVRPPKLAYFPHEWAVKLAKILPNWQHFNLDNLIKSEIDILVNPKARKIDELYVKPVGFTEGVTTFLHDSKARYFSRQDDVER